MLPAENVLFDPLRIFNLENFLNHSKRADTILSTKTNVLKRFFFHHKDSVRQIFCFYSLRCENLASDHLIWDVFVKMKAGPECFYLHSIKMATFVPHSPSTEMEIKRFCTVLCLSMQKLLSQPQIFNRLMQSKTVYPRSKIIES